MTLTLSLQTKSDKTFRVVQVKKIFQKCEGNIKSRHSNISNNNTNEDIVSTVTMSSSGWRFFIQSVTGLEENLSDFETVTEEKSEAQSSSGKVLMTVILPVVPKFL